MPKRRPKKADHSTDTVTRLRNALAKRAKDETGKLSGRNE